jgi:NADH-quinone oxidoreductase subunit K
MHLVYPTVLASLLFCIGMYGVLARRNAVLVLMSIEIMLNAVNINLVAFNAWLQDTLLQGQLFALFVITVAAAEVGVGLAIVLLIFRNRETVDIDSLREMGDTAPPPRRTAAAGDVPRQEVPAHRG